MKQVNTTINNNEYQMIKFGAKDSLKMATRLAKSMSDNKDSISNVDMQTVLVSIIANDEFSDLIEKLCVNITFKGLSIDFDSHFTEHPKDLLPVVGWSLKENVMGFFDPTALATLAETALADLQ